MTVGLAAAQAAVARENALAVLPPTLCLLIPRRALSVSSRRKQVHAPAVCLPCSSTSHYRGNLISSALHFPTNLVLASSLPRIQANRRTNLATARANAL